MTTTRHSGTNGEKGGQVCFTTPSFSLHRRKQLDDKLLRVNTTSLLCVWGLFFMQHRPVAETQRSLAGPSLKTRLLKHLSLCFFLPSFLPSSLTGFALPCFGFLPLVCVNNASVCLFCIGPSHSVRVCGRKKVLAVSL